MNLDNSPGAFNEHPEGLGIPQFQTDASFYMILNGIVIQGGKLPSLAVGNHTVAFPAALSQQLLQVQLTEIGGSGFVRVNPATPELTTLGITVTCASTPAYWFVVGV